MVIENRTPSLFDANGKDKFSPGKLLIDLLHCFLVLTPLLTLGYMFALVDTPPCHACINTVRWPQLFIGCVYALSMSGLGVMCGW